MGSWTQKLSPFFVEQKHLVTSVQTEGLRDYFGPSPLFRAFASTHPVISQRNSPSQPFPRPPEGHSLPPGPQGHRVLVYVLQSGLTSPSEALPSSVVFLSIGGSLYTPRRRQGGQLGLMGRPARSYAVGLTSRSALCSTELMRRVRRFQIAQYKCLVIKYAKDTRYSNNFSTHDR